MPVHYFDGTTDVLLGDRVGLKVWFRERVGRVVLCPAFLPSIQSLNITE